jgi:hypothetical protein
MVLMKIKEAIEALQQGKRIKRLSSDSPVNLCDHLGDDGFNGFYELCHNDVVVKLIPVSACAAEVKHTYSLKEFEFKCSMPYLNFEEYEKSTRK